MIHDLDGAELLERVNERYGGSVPKEVITSAELRELFVPALRADFTALETYQHSEHPPLECSITAFGGRHDPTLPAAALEAWATHTSGDLRVRLVEGEHFFLQSARQQLLDGICEDVCAVLAPVSARGA